ncbi:MAG: helix-turn-helix transcriptional regulator [Lachnospiraceae bacterium]|nr:helix-turn-helix transcriptional regulator [Oscillospiraceae bacterium]MBR3279287.1 helix-turn-helix transcriptional regulator [Lachnospiraceae bacterium]
MGNKFKALREGKGIKLRFVAATIGVSPAKMSRIENGIRVPDAETFLKLCQFYDVDPKSFMC